MKKYYLILCLLLLYVSGRTQPTDGFSYQAVVRDAGGHIIANKQVSIRISIIRGNSTGTVIYSEEFSPTTNTYGLVNLTIGRQKPEEFNQIDWSQKPCFIKVELDPEGGINYILSGTSQLLSVPYALYAEKTGSQDETDPLFQRWDKSSGIQITSDQVTDIDLIHNNIAAEINTTQHGAGLNRDGSYQQHESANYISNTSSLSDADLQLDTELKATADNLAQEIVDRISAITSEETERIEAINIISAKIKNDSTFLKILIDNEITDRKLDVDTEEAARIAADNELQSKINSQNSSLQTKLDTEISNREQADSDLQNELDASQTGAGLANNGSYSKTSTANYIADATSLNEADVKLDAQAKTNADNLATEITNRGTAVSAEQTAREVADNALQNELDASQTGAGLANDGSYSKNSAANYIADATSLNNADVKLDAQAKTNADNLAAEITNRGTAVSAEQTAREVADNALQNELDASQTGAGLANNGSYSKNSAANYIADATSLNNADVKLDTQTKTNADNLAAEITNRGTAVSTEQTAREVADNALQNELDASQTGAGLANDGSYSKNSTANYIADATSLNEADVKLDAQTKTNADNLATEITNRGTAVSAEQTAREVADNALQNELDASQTGAGLANNGSYSKNSAANYIADATSLNNADVKLDAQAKTNADNLAAEIANRGIAVNAEQTARENADNTLQNEFDATQTGAGLANNGSYTKNTSANFIASANSLNDADVKLDAQVKTNADNLAAEIANRGIAVNAEQTARENADNTLQNELNATQTGAGLANNGSYTKNTSANFIASANSLNDADVKLDAQVKNNTTAIALNTSKLNVTEGTATAGKAVVLDGSGNIAGLNNVNASKVTGSNMQTDDYLYFGDPDTDGTWRMKPSADGLLFECRESGSWVEKMTILK